MDALQGHRTRICSPRASSCRAGAVGMLMQLAKRETGADGKPVDKFLIEVKETGEFTVNGNPM